MMNDISRITPDQSAARQDIIHTATSLGIDPLICARVLCQFSNTWHPWAALTGDATESKALCRLINCQLVEYVGEVFIPLAKKLTVGQRLRGVPTEHRVTVVASGVNKVERLDEGGVNYWSAWALSQQNALPSSWLVDGKWTVKPHPPQMNPEFARLRQDGQEIRDAMRSCSGTIPHSLFTVFCERLMVEVPISTTLIVPDQLRQIRDQDAPTPTTTNIQININGGDGYTSDDRERDDAMAESVLSADNTPVTAKQLALHTGNQVNERTIRNALKDLPKETDGAGGGRTANAWKYHIARDALRRVATGVLAGVSWPDAAADLRR